MEAARIEGRVIVVDAERNLVADSSDSGLDRTFDRPEIDAALSGDLASDVRYSQTLASELRYVAAPIVQNFQVVGAVRLSLSESDVDRQIRTTQAWLAAFVVGVVIAAGLVAWLLSRSIAAPLTRLAVVAGNLPNDLDLRASETDGPKEVRDVAASLNSTAAKLAGIIDRTERVAADASHHLRTPLTGLRLRLEAIADTASDQGVHDEAELAIGEVDRLTRRIDQVLALARTDAGDSRRFPVDLAEIAQHRSEAAAPIAEESGIRIDVESAGECSISAPAGIPARIVDELLGNALSYARSRIAISVSREGTAVVMQVADDGPGIPDTETERVFARFHRAPGAIPGGSGLGLALVRETVEALGGSASAGRSDMGGAVVTVRLPAFDSPILDG
jgi:signal transduction histidine kinase